VLTQHHVLHPNAHLTLFQGEETCETDVVAAIMTQLSLKAGLRQWGDKAKDAVLR